MWIDLSKKSWSSYNELHFYNLTKTTNLFERINSNVDVNSILYHLLTRCGKYLRSVYLSDCEDNEVSKFDMSLIICYLARNCNNITNLVIDGNHLRDKDAHYGLLFSKSKHLEILEIGNSKIDGICLQNLHFDGLKVLSLKDTIISPKTNLSIHFKNLSKFMSTETKSTDAVASLSMFEANTLEFSFPCERRVNTFKIFIDTKNFKSLILSKMNITSEIKTYFPLHSIEHFALDNSNVSSDYLIYCLQNFKNLTVLRLPILTISENLIKAISCYQSLINLDLSFTNLFLFPSSAMNKLFKDLGKLEFLDVSATDIDDKYLEIISLNCKHLNCISLNYCDKITAVGSGFITFLPKFENLIIRHAHLIRDGSLKLIKKLKKLSCGNIHLITEDYCNINIVIFYFISLII